MKPQGLPGLAEELAPVLQARKGNAPVVVSMATAVTLRELDAMLGGGLPLIRIMPNTPAAVGAGTILYAAQNVTDAQLNAFRAVLAQAGLLLPLPEKDPRGPVREPRPFHGGLLAFARLERRGAGGREPHA